jgi:hypothetical protein
MIQTASGDIDTITAIMVMVGPLAGTKPTAILFGGHQGN